MPPGATWSHPGSRTILVDGYFAGRLRAKMRDIGDQKLMVGHAR
jgi:hypothetical protein